MRIIKFEKSNPSVTLKIVEKGLSLATANSMCLSLNMSLDSRSPYRYAVEPESDFENDELEGIEHPVFET